MDGTNLNLIGLISVEHYQRANVICFENDASNNRGVLVSRNILSKVQNVIL